MTTYAWIENGSVRDLVTTDPTTIFHSDVADLYSTIVPDGTKQGATEVNGSWTNPVPPSPAPEPAPAPCAYPLLSAVQFYDAFTPQEETAILASTDPLVQTFVRRLDRAMSTGTQINPNLLTVQEGLQYLTKTIPPLIANTSRIPQILAGEAQ